MAVDLLAAMVSKKGLNLGAVAGVNAEEGQCLAHANFGNVELHIEVVPELLLSGLRSLGVEFDGAKSESSPYTLGGFETVITVKVLKFVLQSQDEQVERRSLRESNESVEGSLIGFSNLAGLDGVGDGVLEDVLSVVLPDASEVRLIGNEGGHLVGVNEVLLFHKLGSHFAQRVVLSLELSAALLSSGVNSEDKGLLLICVGEAVQLFESLLLIIGVFEKMAAGSPPSGLRNFIVEKTGRKALAEELNAEKLKRVRALAHTRIWDGGPLGLHVLHGVFPGLSGVNIDLPAVFFLGSSPVRDGETLEDGTGKSVEPNITDTLEKGLGVEVLLINVVHDVGVLVELVDIDVLDAEAYIILN